MYHRYYANGAWGTYGGAWDNLGGSVATAVAASLYPTRMDIFGNSYGTYTGSTILYHKVWSSNAWSSWESLGQANIAYPAAVTYLGPQHMEVFEPFNDGVYRKYWNGSSWVPSITGWSRVSGTIPIPGSTLVTSWGSTRLDVFTLQNLTNFATYKLVHTFSDDGGLNWSPWETIPGQ